MMAAKERYVSDGLNVGLPIDLVQGEGLLLTAGFYSTCVWLLPPLPIPSALLETPLDVLEDAFRVATT